jgi:hypothetical protein
MAASFSIVENEEMLTKDIVPVLRVVFILSYSRRWYTQAPYPFAAAALHWL